MVRSARATAPTRTAPAADLTDEFRIELNPEGVLYYKI